MLASFLVFDIARITDRSSPLLGRAFDDFFFLNALKPARVRQETPTSPTRFNADIQDIFTCWHLSLVVEVVVQSVPHDIYETCVDGILLFVSGRLGEHARPGGDVGMRSAIC